MKYLLLACIMICIAPTTHAQPAVTKKDPPLFVPYRDGKLWGYSDTMGKVLVQPAYDSVSQHSVDGFVYKNGKVGIINEWGKVKLATLYDDIYSDAPYDETFYVASKSSKKGVFNNNGKPLVPMIYDTIQSIEERIIVVGTKNKRGLYTIAGKLLVPVEYDEITDQFFDEKADHSRSIMGRKGNKYWLLSKATGRAYPYIFKGDDSEEGVTEEVMANVVEDYNDSVSNSADSVKKRFQADRVVDISFTKGYISKDYLLVIKNGKQGLFHRPSEPSSHPTRFARPQKTIIT